MDSALSIRDLTKSYGRNKVLNGVNLELKKGKILGLLGPNGSGKTTLLKAISGLVRPNSGQIEIYGNSPNVYTKSIVSFLPDTNHLFKWMKIKDAVSFYKDFFSDFDTLKSKELLEFMNLSENSSMTQLSKGMIEKLNLTLVLSRKAKLFMFDEPLGGVDPSARDKIIDAIIKTCDEGNSMVLSTHLVKDVERLFDSVAFLSEGSIILQGNTDEIKNEKKKSIDEIFREVF